MIAGDNSYVKGVEAMRKKSDAVEVLESKYLFRRPWLTVRQEHIRLVNGAEVPEYYVLEYPDWVNILAITKDKKFVMVRQYRHGSQTTNFEFCGGVVDKTDESPLAAAQRELLEETGFGGGKWRQNLKMSANPSTTNNWIYNFIAEDVELVEKQHLDGGEDLSWHLLSLAEIKDLLRKGEIIQSGHACALWKYMAENHLW